MAKGFLYQPVKIDQRKHQSEVKLFNALARKYRSGATFKQIAITEFCRSAGVSRATFYRHHQTLTDIIVVQFLIVIAGFERQIDTLTQADFANSSQIVVATIYTNLELIKMVPWSGAQAQVQALLSGTAQQILMLRDHPKATQNFVSGFLGAAILNFALQIATVQEPITKATALKLYQQLLPNSL
ncbi:hypothetical protein [Loigolactobacillus jiayinensis]|uniref:TetR/AcrR family transcriptional regulator n=1 Tax=Loigolactobacillus jiayinensis TaxID=2486016 RepID=A0ABW1RGF3_9LACO|nr:hypothetical protein [Loigolactobacillus jiayinensis]